MQSRRNVLEILAETLDDRDGVARYRVVGRPGAQDGERDNGGDHESSRATTGHGLPEPLLPVPNQVFKIGRGLAVPGVAPTAVTFLWWH